jgi:hypothetical protein
MSEPAPQLTREQRDALKAFKKKLKATQLEEDSRLGHGPLSTDKGKVVAIQPPTGHGRAVWDELVALGHLTRDGSFYELVRFKPAQ